MKKSTVFDCHVKIDQEYVCEKKITYLDRSRSSGLFPSEQGNILSRVKHDINKLMSEDKIDHRSYACTQLKSSCEIKAWKSSGLNGIRTHDLWDTGAALYQRGLAWHWWNSTDLGLIGMYLTNLNAEIVACILVFRKLGHKPNLESTSKYGFSPNFGGKCRRRSERCACKLSWTLFSPAGVQPL